MDLDSILQFFDPFMDSSGEVYVQVVPAGTAEPHQIPLESSTARFLIKAELVKALGGRLPTDHQARSCMDILWATAYLAERRTAELSFAYLLARDPVAQAVLAIHRRGGTKQPAKQLLVSLVRMARLEGIDIAKGKWPPNEDALGRRLSNLIEPFTKAGIPISYDDKTRPRTWTIAPRIIRSGQSGSQVAAGSNDTERISAPEATTSLFPGTPPDDVATPVTPDEPGGKPYTEHDTLPIAQDEMKPGQTHGPPRLEPIENHGSDEMDDIPSEEEISHLWETTR